MSIKLERTYEEIIQTIALYTDGITIDNLLGLLKNRPAKRTVQYRISNLVKNGTIKRIGHGKSSKYAITENIPQKKFEKDAFDPQKTSIIPLSIEGEKLKILLSSPIQVRQHVSYRREFLDSYEPNQTFYLSKGTLNKLLKLGSGADRGRPAGTYARKIYQRLLIDLSWNSSRLEGNTYSLLQTEQLLATGEEATGKNWMDTQMILNHRDAIEFIVEMAEEININRHTVLNVHALLSNNLLLDPKACGRLRQIPVKIGQSVYHPIEVPQLIEEQFQLIIQKAAAINNPFEQSFFLMVHLPYLQPFIDINKRVSRLVGNIPFIRENLSPLSFIDVPVTDYIQGLLAIYELNRIELFQDIFVWAYERSASFYLATLEAIGQPDIFRIRYRELIRQAIFEVIQYKMKRPAASKYIAQFAEDHIPCAEQNHFIEIVEFEIISLHEGNFARFKIRSSDFFLWQKEWK